MRQGELRKQCLKWAIFAPASILGKRLQLLAGFEAHGPARRNAYFRARPGIAADSGLAGFYVKDTKTAKFNAVVSGKSLLHGFEDGLDSGFRFSLGNPGAVDDFVNDIELYQTNLLKIQVLILESGFGVVKNFLLHYDEAKLQRRLYVIRALPSAMAEIEQLLNDEFAGRSRGLRMSEGWLEAGNSHFRRRSSQGWARGITGSEKPI